MPIDTAHIDVFTDGHWQLAARFRPANPDQGYRGSGEFEYLLDYAVDYAGPMHADRAAVSCRYPVDFDLHSTPYWPAFLLDILPAGYGRQQWLEQLAINDGPSADWPLLLRGAAFPPGNLRIAEAAAAKNTSTRAPTEDGGQATLADHPGFSREAVISRNEYFVEYAVQHGIYAAGASDVQGAAPKLLLVQDTQGRWHAEGALQDEQVAACWLLKRPRGGVEVDRLILQNEAAYMAVANDVGIRVHAALEWEGDNLLIPRFDRIAAPGAPLQRLGMESLCSLAGVSDFGTPLSQDQLCQALLRYSSEPEDDLLEFIRRDILNVVLGNKDNHARNSAVLKTEDGLVQLSPLFDFAPMYLDPQGIARVCRWEGDAETAGTPDWGKILARYQQHLPNSRGVLRNFATHLRALPEIMQQHGVDDSIISHRRRAIDDHAQQLEAL